MPNRLASFSVSSTPKQLQMNQLPIAPSFSVSSTPKQLQMNQLPFAPSFSVPSGPKQLRVNALPVAPIYSSTENVKRLHHLEFWCHDASTTAKHFSHSLGIPIVAKSDCSTGNAVHSSYVLQLGEVYLIFSAPYSIFSAPYPTGNALHSSYVLHLEARFEFLESRGLGVQALAFEVENAVDAYRYNLGNYAGKHSTVRLKNGVTLSEVNLHRQLVIRYMSDVNDGLGFPDFSTFKMDPSVAEIGEIGINKLDHVEVCFNPLQRRDHLSKLFGLQLKSNTTGFCKGDELFGALCYKGENLILLKDYGEKGWYDGITCVSFATDCIFTTLKQMKKRLGGFQFPDPPEYSISYFEELQNEVGTVLTSEQIFECISLGISVHRRGRNVMLEATTCAIGDRPNLFVSVVQRLESKDEEDHFQV